MSTRKLKTENQQFYRYCRRQNLQAFPRPVSDIQIRGVLRQLYDLDGAGGDAHLVCDAGHLGNETIEWCLQNILERPGKCHPDGEVRGLSTDALLAYRSLPRKRRTRIYNRPF
jgi:hypothetical protein